MMRFLSLCASFSLHAGLFLLGIYASLGASVHIDPGKRIYTVDLVRLPAPAPIAKPAQKKTAVPGKKAPDKKTSVKKISAHKVKPKPKRIVKKKPAPKKKPLSSSQIIAQALQGVQGEVRTKTRKEKQALARELAGLRSSVDKDNGLAHGRGNTSRESGLTQVYGQIAEAAIKQHWRFPRVGKKNLTARIEVRVDHGGKVLGTKVLVSSGRKDFDGSALRAIHEAEPLPKPPSSTIKRLIINFNLSELQE